jgi:HlyD family secretion protein
MTAERDAYIQGWRAEVSQKLSEATRKLSDARELLNKAKLRRELVELRAESDATVQSVAKVSVGSVMQSGQHFFTLVPADAPLEIEANIFGRENGFVHVGDPVEIKFDTFPIRNTAWPRARCGSSARTASPRRTRRATRRAPCRCRRPAPSRSTGPASRSTKWDCTDVPGGFRVVPGMPVTADIKVGKRTVLKYLLGRMMPLAQEGMREP